MFATQPNLSTTLQSQAYSIVKSEIEIRTRTVNGKIYFFFPSKESKYKQIKEEEINQHLKKKKNFVFRNFDNYVEFSQRMWIVIYDETDWRLSTCSCPTFAKEYICKHSLAVAILNNKFSVRPEAKSFHSMDKKRPRGRPAKISKALVRD